MPNVVRREKFADDGGERERTRGDLCLSQLGFVTDCQLDSGEEDPGSNI